jgi:hypothetical protein
MDPLNGSSPSTKTLAISGRPEEKEDANAHVLPGHGRGGGFSRTYNQCASLREGAFYQALHDWMPPVTATGD